MGSSHNGYRFRLHRAGDPRSCGGRFGAAPCGCRDRSARSPRRVESGPSSARIPGPSSRHHAQPTRRTHKKSARSRSGLGVESASGPAQFDADPAAAGLSAPSACGSRPSGRPVTGSSGAHPGRVRPAGSASYRGPGSSWGGQFQPLHPERAEPSSDPKSSLARRRAKHVVPKRTGNAIAGRLVLEVVGHVIGPQVLQDRILRREVVGVVVNHVVGEVTHYEA